MKELAKVQGIILSADRSSIELTNLEYTTYPSEAEQLRTALDTALSLRTGKPRPDACLKSYAEVLGEFAQYPDSGKGTVNALSYAALGLCGEAGEVAEKLKKRLRDGTWDRDAVALELGDVLWYWLRLCVELGLNPDDVAAGNLAKLQSRMRRGVIGGSGDKR